MQLAYIIKPLVGQSPHHFKNTQHFVQLIHSKRLEPGEVMTSFDVKALFTSVPVDPSIHIVQQEFAKDSTLPQRSNMFIQQIVTLLQFCLTDTYFLFQGKFYEQVHGAAMGSPINSLTANLFMEEFEVKALSSCSHPPSLWLRFVDDTSVITKAEHSKTLLQHINNQDPHIQFTVEELSQQGTLPFLDTLVTIQPKNTFTTTVYRKPTCTGQYLHCNSNHFITAKQSVYNTLAHRAKVVSSKQEALDQELSYIRRALQACQFPNWALNQLQYKFHRNSQPSKQNNNIPTNTTTTNNNTNRNITIVVPTYIQGTEEKVKKVALCQWGKFF